MSVKYYILEKGQPGAVGGGIRKFYAAAKTTGTMDLNRLTKAIEKISTVNGADIRAVLYALTEVASDELADGRIVSLGDLGSLRLSVSSKSLDTPEEVNAASIKGTKVIFKPGRRLVEMQKNLRYEKIPTDKPV